MSSCVIVEDDEVETKSTRLTTAACVCPWFVACGSRAQSGEHGVELYVCFFASPEAFPVHDRQKYKLFAETPVFLPGHLGEPVCALAMSRDHMWMGSCSRSRVILWQTRDVMLEAVRCASHGVGTTDNVVGGVPEHGTTKVEMALSVNTGR
jgi:hypothetical protein